MRLLLLLCLFISLPATAASGTLKELPAQAAAPLALGNLKGDKLDVGQLHGKVVVVNFWATWCPPCRKEMPSMQRLSDKLASRPFAMLGVNVGESAEEVQAFLKQVPLDFPILLDADGVSLKPWQVFAFPTSYVLDKQGRLRLGLFGSIEWDAPDVVERIEALLAEQG
jgi:thiol-disulfide isomerase/thioredoxin